MTDVKIPADEILAVVEWLLKFPYPQVCRHLVVCEIMSRCEKHGLATSSDMARAVVRCHDDEALRLLAEMRSASSP